jgi:L-cysteine/cystine lyase
MNGTSHPTDRRQRLAELLRREARAPVPVDRHRERFPTLARSAYFNYGGRGPLPRDVTAAMAESVEFAQEWGPFSTEANYRAETDAARARAALAALTGVEPDSIALTAGAAHGCNIVFWGMDWAVGDRLLLPDGEHPAVGAAAHHCASRLGFDVVPLARSELADGRAGHPTPRDRLLVLSHVTWDTGEVRPVREIAAACRARGVRVLLDSAQSIGALPTDLADLGVDYAAFTGGKWLCGPEGIGGLYVRQGAETGLQPTFAGWGSFRAEGGAHGWWPGARRFEQAPPPAALCAGLTAAIAVHDEWAPPAARFEQVRAAAANLWRRLRTMTALGVECAADGPPEGGIVSFRTPGHPQQLVHHLEARGVLARLVTGSTWVRACTHYLTTETDLDRFAHGVEAYLTGTEA